MIFLRLDCFHFQKLPRGKVTANPSNVKNAKRVFACFNRWAIAHRYDRECTISHGNQQTNKNEAWRFWFLEVWSFKTSHVGKLCNIVVLIPADTSLPNLQKWHNELWNSGSQWCLLPRKLTTVPRKSMVGRWKVLSKWSLLLGTSCSISFGGG